jgi:hypothetical protein
MTDIVERLRSEAADVIDRNGKTMKQWDEIRHRCETLKGSDLPRLMFESLVESLAELMVEGADEIDRLRAVQTTPTHSPRQCGGNTGDHHD